MNLRITFARKSGHRIATQCYVAVLLMAVWPALLPGQELHLTPFADSQTLPFGIQVNRVSTYMGGFDLTVPPAGGSDLSSRSLGTVFGGGLSTDMGWYLPGRRTEAFVDIGFSYDGNWRYRELNGTNYRLSLGVQRKLSPSVTVSFGGVAESSMLADYVFGSTRDLTLSGQSSTLDQLSGSLSGLAVPIGVGASPLSISLFGAKRRDAAVEASMVITQSPRFSWHFGTSLMRDLPSDVPATGQIGSVVYPGVSKGSVSGGFTYSLSRRTQVAIDMDYARSFSSYDRIQIVSGTAGIDHVLAKQWFVHFRAGYGALAELQTLVSSPVRREYHGDAGIGTKLRDHTFLVTASRSIADSYGLGAGNTTGGQIAWIWHRPSGNWTLESSAVYERLEGRTIQVLGGWLYQADLVRRLTRQTSLGMQMVYATNSGHFSGGGFTSLMRRGVRVSMTWTPAKNR
jgi:hypothetical protein